MIQISLLVIPLLKIIKLRNEDMSEEFAPEEFLLDEEEEEEVATEDAESEDDEDAEGEDDDEFSSGFGEEPEE